MSVYKQKGSNNWSYKFVWRGKVIRESTKQTNKRVAEQMEAARRTQLAKGEVGIRDRKPVPTLVDFAEKEFLPFARATFASKPNTLTFYESGVKAVLSFERIAKLPLDRITTEEIAAYVTLRRADGKKVSTINRQLQTLRRMFALAQEWERVEKALPKVRMLGGENHRERVITADEESLYLENAGRFDQGEPILVDVAIILLDCALRPEECFRLTWPQVHDGFVEIQYGKTDNARRRIPLSERAAEILAERRAKSVGVWVFAAKTRSGHIEPGSLKRQHRYACEGSHREENKKVKNKDKKWSVQPFPLYTLRHTCLTRWAPHMDPWTLAYLAGHRDMSITKRYVHPQEQQIRIAIEKARDAQTGHSSRHSEKSQNEGDNSKGDVKDGKKAA